MGNSGGWQRRRHVQVPWRSGVPTAIHTHLINQPPAAVLAPPFIPCSPVPGAGRPHLLGHSHTFHAARYQGETPSTGSAVQRSGASQMLKRQPSGEMAVPPLVPLLALTPPWSQP